MRAFKARCNIISAAVAPQWLKSSSASPRQSPRGSAQAAQQDHAAPHHMCERLRKSGAGLSGARRRRSGGGARRRRSGGICLLACLDASISCRIPLES